MEVFTVYWQVFAIACGSETVFGQGSGCTEWAGVNPPLDTRIRDNGIDSIFWSKTSEILVRVGSYVTDWSRWFATSRLCLAILIL